MQVYVWRNLRYWIRIPPCYGNGFLASNLTAIHPWQKRWHRDMCVEFGGDKIAAALGLDSAVVVETDSRASSLPALSLLAAVA